MEDLQSGLQNRKLSLSTLPEKGRSLLATPLYIPQHNGLSKRIHHHLVETSCTLLHHASLLLTFLSYALQTTTYLINRMPSPVLKMKNPFEILF